MEFVIRKREPVAPAKSREVRGRGKIMILKGIRWAMYLTSQPARRSWARFAESGLEPFKTKEL